MYARCVHVQCIHLECTCVSITTTGKYFSQYLQDQIEKKSLGGASEVRNILEEVWLYSSVDVRMGCANYHDSDAVSALVVVVMQVPISTLEHTVMKLYLEDFQSFCLSLGPGTAEVNI
jgi:hypothetical protein